MNDSNKKIYDNRLEKLKNLIAKEFPSDRFEIIFKEKDIISIAVLISRTGKERVPRIEFSTNEEFMTDLDSDFKKIFEQGIQIAKNVLDNPPTKHRILQGEIQLIHDGPIFKKRQNSK